jgi:hypothetical protein
VPNCSVKAHNSAKNRAAHAAKQSRQHTDSQKTCAHANTKRTDPKNRIDRG